ncbi:hypothetical protein Tco_1502434 [Tanacetum coccineum]
MYFRIKDVILVSILESKWATVCLLYSGKINGTKRGFLEIYLREEELEDTGVFSVASVRRKIDDLMLPRVDYITRWNNFVPIKVNVHAWKTMGNALPTRFNISRRDVYKLITRWWEVPDLIVDSYEGWLSWITEVRLPKKNKKMLEGGSPIPVKDGDEVAKRG